MFGPAGASFLRFDRASEEIKSEQMLTPHQVVAVLRAALLFWQEEIAIHEPGVGYCYWQDQPYDPRTGRSYLTPTWWFEI